jgi:predicted phosphodiesterase
MKQILTIIVLAILTTSCDKWNVGGFFAQSGKNVDGRFEESIAYNESHSQVIVSVATDEYIFYAFGDTHVEETTTNLTKMMNLARNDSNAAFIFFLGDFINITGAFNRVKEATAFHPADQQYNKILLTTVGNHDLYFNQWKDYARLFGTSTYVFEVKTPNFCDLYIVLDSGSGTLGAKQLKWLKKMLKEQRAKHRRCIVCSHTNMFKTDNSQTVSGNYALEETNELTSLFADYQVDMYLNGHDHSFGMDKFRKVTYLTAPSMQDYISNPAYLILTVGEQVYFEKKEL